MNIPGREPPKRLAILLALQSLLNEISTIDGDAFDMAEQVFVNRVLIGVDIAASKPILSVIEAPRPDFALFAGEENKMRRDWWTVMIQGITPDDKTENSVYDPFYLCQDVERRLSRISAEKKNTLPEFPESFLLGGKITAIEIAPPVIRPPEAQVSSHAFFYLPIRLGVAMKIGE